MRLVADSETGELYEALDTDLVGGEPYDYAAYRRTVMGHTKEHRQAIRDYGEKARRAAQAEGEYRKAIALHLPAVKAEHGATVAEAMVKGVSGVVEAYERKLAAEAEERAALERIRLCRDDRVAIVALGAWSREANADGWRGAPS